MSLTVVYYIAAVIGGLVLVFGAKIREWLFKRWQFELLKHVIPVQKSWLSFWSQVFDPKEANTPSPLTVCPSVRLFKDHEEGDADRPFMFPSEVEVLLKLAKVLAPYPIELRLHATKTPYSPEDRNIFLMGGWFHTTPVEQTDKAVLRERGFRVEEQPVGCERYRCGDYEIGCTHNKNDTSVIEEDIGAIIRFKTETGREILNCRGMHAFGTAAAVLLALDPAFQKTVKRSKLREYVQLLRVPVRGQVLDYEHTIWSKEYRLVDISPTGLDVKNRTVFGRLIGMQELGSSNPVPARDYGLANQNDKVKNISR